MPKKEKKFITFKEAAALTGFSKSYLYQLTHLRRIPYYRPFGKMIFFKPEELEELFEKNRIATADEIEAKAVNYVVTGRKGGEKL